MNSEKNQGLQELILWHSVNTQSNQKQEKCLQMKKYLKNIMSKFMKLVFIFIRIGKNRHECIPKKKTRSAR